jgi:predicted phosphodiesterase
MSVWGLISDVHGNLPALHEALRVVHARGAVRLAFLGDYLGRGDSDACAHSIRELADVAVVGNRDLDWQDRVAPETRAWVLSLPRSAVMDGVLVAHGDARLTRRLGTNQIARQFADAWQEMDERGARVWVFGHSHFARTWRKSASAAPAELLGTRAALEVEGSGCRYFVNVGTTGLPFPGKGGPSVAVLDLANGWVEHIPLTWQAEK